jgi:parallel beta-helix repeat protein
LAFSKANVENCNITDSYYGIQCNGYAEPNIIGCAISNCVNGIYSYLCRSNIRNCTIKNNGANGIYGYMSYLSLKNSIISNNGRDGIAIENGSYPDIINNVIEYNGYAGIDCYEECAPNIENNLIMNNLETGMLFNYYCLPNIVNNLIAGSIKGIHLANWSDANIINNTVTGNDFAFRLYGDCTPQIINTIVWDNIEVIDPLEDHYYYYNSNPILFSSLIQGDSLHYSITDQGDNIIGIDPLFIDDSLDFNLQSSSPCIESGFNDIVELPEFDLLGNPRIVGGLIDIGAYEYQGSR